MAPLFLVHRALLLILVSISSRFCFCKNSSSILSCNNEDREALLMIKRSIYDDPFNLLQSWKSKGDCCKWKGVGCDAASGHVIKLELLPIMTDHEYAYNGESSVYFVYTPSYALPSPWAYELSPHLVELKHINHLDLSGISLDDGSSIPKFIGWMKQLRYLNLSGMNFEGKIPHVLGNLTKLEVLDFGDDANGLVVEDITWISSLVALRYLGLSGVNLEKTQCAAGVG